MRSTRPPSSSGATARVGVPDDVRYQGSLPTIVESRSRRLRGRLVIGAFAALFAIAIGYVVYGANGGSSRADERSGAQAAPPPSASRSVSSPKATLSGVPMPLGNIPGWRQTFADDFADGLGNPPRWHIYDGAPDDKATSRFSPEQVSAGNGLVTVTASRANGNSYVTGGLCNSNVFSQTYGRFDVRFRMDEGTGIAYAIRLLPTVELSLPQIDVLEDRARDRQGATAVVRDDARDTHINRNTIGDFTMWHTATVEWSPARLVYRLDGKVWATVKAPNVQKIPMSVTIRTYAPRCSDGFGCPGPSTPARVNLYVDWVVAYAATR